VALRILGGEVDGRLQVRFRQWCPRCRKVVQHTIWADFDRLAEVLSWQAGVGTESVEVAA